MVLTLTDGREVEVEVGGKYADDIQVESAAFVNSAEEVPEDCIEELQENYADEMYEEWMFRRQQDADFYMCDLHQDEA